MREKSRGTKLNPLVSVVICTQNRASMLLAAIASICTTKPAVSFEVIVVDNGSIDDTRKSVLSLTDVHVSYIFEGRIGLSRARNTGLSSAKGLYVAFLDDDAIARPGWLEAIVDGFRYDSSAASIGGPVRPIWHAPRPEWLQDEVAHGLTILDWGRSPIRLDLSHSWLVGANMAFKRDVLVEVGGFDLRLGRHGTSLLSNEDTFVLRQIERRGYITLYWPKMEICHPVFQTRLDKDWLVQRNFWQGVSDARVWKIESEASRHGRLLQAMREVKSLPQVEEMLAVSDEGSAFTQRCRAARQAGLITELLGGAES